VHSDWLAVSGPDCHGGLCYPLVTGNGNTQSRLTVTGCSLKYIKVCSRLAFSHLSELCLLPPPASLVQPASRRFFRSLSLLSTSSCLTFLCKTSLAFLYLSFISTQLSTSHCQISSGCFHCLYPRYRLPALSSMLAFAKLASLYALVASLSLITAAAKHGSPRRRHPGTTYLRSNETHEMFKRADNARMTFYEAGLGACGKVNNDGDFVSRAAVCALRPLGSNYPPDDTDRRFELCCKSRMPMSLSVHCAHPSMGMHSNLAVVLTVLRLLLSAIRARLLKHKSWTR
jgi:hypothetical protein